MAFLHSVPAGIGPAVRRFGPSLLRLAAGAAVLWFLVRQVGAAPFEDGLRAVTWQAVVAAVTLTALTTVCSAWRWRVVARALGADIGLRGATGAYYRSLFLNSVLPGGILGDVHRAVTHGRRAGDVARGVRAVAWERLCGQVIQAVVTAVVLLTLPSPVRPALPYVLAGIAGVAGCAALVVGVAARRGRSRPARAARAVAADLRRGLLVPGVWPQVTLASLLVVAGHTATFVIAARVAGCTAPLGELIALLMVVQIAAGIPLSVGGWGPREGAAAWAFAAAGLGAANGVTVATLYAVLMLAAVAPGAGLLLGDAIRRRRGPGHSGESRGPDPAPRTMEAGAEGMTCFRGVLNAPPSRTGTPARYTSGPRTDDRHPHRGWSALQLAMSARPRRLRRTGPAAVAGRWRGASRASGPRNQAGGRCRPAHPQPVADRARPASRPGPPVPPGPGGSATRSGSC